MNSKKSAAVCGNRMVLAVVCAVLLTAGCAEEDDLTAQISVLSDTASGDAESGDASADALPAASGDAGDIENAAEAVQPVTITLSFVGDCTLGTDETFSYSGLPGYYEKYGADYFFEGVRSVFEADDLTVINLEGTFTDSDDRAEKTYAFKGDPSYVEILTGSSVEAADLANNHSHDYGTEGYEDTVEILTANGVAAFGNGVIAYYEVQGVKIALIGIYELPSGLGVSSQVTESVQEAREAGADLVVVSFHWGNERESCPEQTQVTLAHQAIDDGADLVIGHHPHVLQGIEYYNGKIIAYSLGNFCFGGNSNPSDKDTVILQMSFTVSQEDADAGGIITSELNVIPCRLSSVTGYNDYQPVILTGDEGQAVLEKLASRSDEIAAVYEVQAVYAAE